MSRRHPPDELTRRLDEVRRQLRSRHAGIEPDAAFAARVLARLPQTQGWSIDWAARRVLPVSVALALVLVIAAVTTGRSTTGAVPSPRASTASSSSAPGTSTSDPLEWLLEDREDVQ